MHVVSKLTLSAVLAGSTALMAAPLLAQTAQGDAKSSSPASKPAAQACMKELRAFDERADKDGYWVTAWGPTRGYATVARPATPPAATTPPTGTATPTGIAARAPWIGERWGLNSPGYQIRTLHAAATVLAQRGDQRACEAVLAELREIYGAYTGELRRAGIEPNEVLSWRQQQILLARPVTELDAGLVNVDNVTGTEVRNAQDVDLGTVDGVVVDPRSGELRYAVVSKGGIFGVGEEHYAVPWKALKATPGMNLFVLNVPEQAVDSAPNVDPGRLAIQEKDDRFRSQVDEYWSKHVSG